MVGLEKKRLETRMDTSCSKDTASATYPHQGVFFRLKTPSPTIVFTLSSNLLVSSRKIQAHLFWVGLMVGLGQSHLKIRSHQPKPLPAYFTNQTLEVDSHAQGGQRTGSA